MFVSVPIADQLQPNFYKLPCVEQRITKLETEKVPCTVSLNVPKLLSSLSLLAYSRSLFGATTLIFFYKHTSETTLW